MKINHLQLQAKKNKQEHCHVYMYIQARCQTFHRGVLDHFVCLGGHHLCLTTYECLQLARKIRRIEGEWFLFPPLNDFLHFRSLSGNILISRIGSMLVTFTPLLRPQNIFPLLAATLKVVKRVKYKLQFNFIFF